MLVPLSLLATASVPWLAFLDGHPYRIRYMVPLIAAQALGAGAAAGLVKRARLVLVPALLLLVAIELRPLDQAAAMVTEAQWDRPNVTARQQVTDCLRSGYQGETIMASMGSLVLHAGDVARRLRHRDFLHEGTAASGLPHSRSPTPAG